MKKTTFLLFFFFLLLSLQAQEWERIFPIQEGSSVFVVFPEIANVSVANDGSYYLFGNHTFKLDSQGDTIWTKAYSSSNGVATPDGGAVLISSISNVHDSLSLKRLNGDGNILWTSPLKGRHIIQDGGGFVFYNDSSAYDEEGNWSPKYLLTKVALDGAVYWNTQLDVTGSFDCNNLIKTNDGGFLLLGQIGWDGAILYANSIGEIQWYNTYPTFGAPNFSGTNSVLSGVNTTPLQQNGEGYVFVGNSSSWGDSDLQIFKVDLNGELLWGQNYACDYGSCSQHNASIVQTTDGYLVVAEVDRRLRVLKVDWMGQKQWDVYYGNRVQLKTAKSLQKTNDGGFVISGSYIYSSLEHSSFLLKLNAAAELVSISEPDLEPISFYPNPTTQLLYFNSKEIRNIYSVLGQLTLTTSEKEVDVSDLTDGVYLVEQAGSYAKFVKK